MSATYIGTSKLRKAFINGQVVKKILLGTEPIYSGAFAFKYSGTCKLNGTQCESDTEYEVEGNYNIEFVTSGTLTVTSIGPTNAFDTFLIDGGYNGGGGSHSGYDVGGAHSNYGDSSGGNGGKSGRSKTVNDFTLSEQTYSIVVGAANGGESQAFEQTTEGGTAGKDGGVPAKAGWWIGGYGTTQTAKSGTVGARPFNDTSLPICGSSGSGGGEGYLSNGGAAAVEGGGKGGNPGQAGSSATTYGSGAGGGAGGSPASASPYYNRDMGGGTGQSGVVILRNHR